MTELTKEQFRKDMKKWWISQTDSERKYYVSKFFSHDKTYTSGVVRSYKWWLMKNKIELL